MADCGCEKENKDLQVTIPKDQYVELLRKARSFDLIVEGAGQLIRNVSQAEVIEKL
ncbi:hypothetical protein [Paenibacillus sp. BAC0078]